MAGGLIWNRRKNGFVKDIPIGYQVDFSEGELAVPDGYVGNFIRGSEYQNECQDKKI